VRVLGIPIESPQATVNRLLTDLGAVARLARTAPRQLDRVLELGEEMAEIGHRVLALAERLDRRAEAIMALGERLDRRAEAIMVLGERLDGRAAELIELGDGMRELGDRIDERGAEIVDRAGGVVETGAELIAVLPAFERALEMATPLEGAIDRFGRLVDRLPGGAQRRRVDPPPPASQGDEPGR
jgi:chromosome segregation ATPase